MDRTFRLSPLWRLLAGGLLLLAMSDAFAASYLYLAQTPLFSGTNAKPNVLVAVDDSGSMDLETLFPTDEGMLYWRDNNGSGADANGEFFVNSGSDIYGYVFPFDQVQSGQTETIPPLPGTAYARDPEYNKAYFNPATSYTPWLKADASGDPRDDVDYTNAPYDPSDNNGTIDLTATQTGRFLLRRGMTISGGGVSYDPDDALSDGRICYNRDSGETAAPVWFFGYFCLGRGFQLIHVDDLPDAPDEPIYSSQYRDISYFPATFYLKVGQGSVSLPTNYGYDPTKTIEGIGPDGEEELIGYELKPDNFTSNAAYRAAIQNFANWFTYYRKRHLATRGGIVEAFHSINDVRVAGCTINNWERLKNNDSYLVMEDLNNLDERASFYSSIFGIDYNTNRGTPNRQALYYLGRQLESNDSIITAPCQRNFAILFTDGYSDDDTISNLNNVDDRYGPPFADDYPDTIADIAMHYYKDLDTDETGILKVPQACRDADPPLYLDCETDLHMVTFGVTLNQTGEIFNNDAYKPENDDPYSNHPTWPNVNEGGRSKKQIDDLWHATINTRGELLNAETPAEVASKFATALERIIGAKGSASGVSLDSASLTTDSTAYQASFLPGAWTGELSTRPQTQAGSLGEPLWQASETLTEPSNSAYRSSDERAIFTSVPSNCGNNNSSWSAARFTWSDLRNRCNSLSQQQIDYLRGDRSKERLNGGTLRNRNDNILGDIVHSSPLYVGPPNRVRYPANWDDLLTDGDERTIEDRAGRYTNPTGSGFAEGPAGSRTPMVYVGANDGMLHGFDANTGEELIGYVPGALLDDVGQLTQPDYIHRYYVDGTPASGDVVMQSGSGYQWRTVLVGGLRAGGKSIYALDITDPDAFSQSNPDDVVLWEYQDSELGNTFGKPSIVRLHNGQWAAVFGNGYNSESGSAQLYIVDIQTGRLIKRIDTYATPGSPLTGDTDNGRRATICHNGRTITVDQSALSAHLNHGDTAGACGETGELANGLGEVFPVDLDGDFITDYIYAGDLYGNLWKFDLTGSSSGQWSVGLGGKPLFVARDADGNRQPITSQPQVGLHPYGSRYGVMVYFGTGKYLETQDRYADSRNHNSLYGIWDLDVFTFQQQNGGDGLFETALKSEIPRSRLQQQRITETTTSNGNTYRLVSDEDVDYQEDDDERGESGKRGWYIDLNGPGELVASAGRIEGDTVAFSTTIPNTETCASSGSGYFMLLDRRTGGRTDYPAFDLNGDNQIKRNDDTFVRDGDRISASGLLIAAGIPGLASHQTNNEDDTAYYLVPSSDGTIVQVFTQKEDDRRVSWREIRR